MKILIYTCHFAPDPISVGKFTGEMAEWLQNKGHDLRVISAPPFYPFWKIAPSYSSWRYESRAINGIPVLRCPIWIPQKQSGLARLFHAASYAASSLLPLCWSSLHWKPDIIWTVMPPLSGTPGALIAAKLGRAKSWLHVQDFEVDAAFELKLLNSTSGRKILLAMERWLLSKFDVVSTITARMSQRLEAKQISTSLKYFPNWADIEMIHPLSVKGALRDELNVKETDFVGLYSGNLGEKQGIECLVEVARFLQPYKDIVVVICGDGAGRARLSDLAQGLENIRLAPLQPLERLNDLLNTADIHLLPQKASVADLVMPSKLGGMLASGRPVIAGAVEGTQIAKEIADCGIITQPGNAQLMAEAILKLRAQPELREKLGRNAVQRAKSNWWKQAIMENFEHNLLELKAM